MSVALGAVVCTSAMALRMNVAERQPETIALVRTTSQSEAIHNPNGALRVKSDVMASQVLTKTPPVYPPDAKAAKVQGAVVLKAVIGKDGAIKSLQLVSGPEVLAKSAWSAVKEWTYKPYLLNGEPVDVETTITVHYSLAGESL
jgi:TonB family protein